MGYYSASLQLAVWMAVGLENSMVQIRDFAGCQTPIHPSVGGDMVEGARGKDGHEQGRKIPNTRLSMRIYLLRRLVFYKGLCF